MKKVLIKLLMLIGIMCLWIVCNSTTSYGAGNLYSYMFGDYTYRIYSTEGAMSYNNLYRNRDVNYDAWVRGICKLASYIDDHTYEEIAKNNSAEDISDARATISSMSSYFQKQTDNVRKIFNEFTGYNATESNSVINDWVAVQYNVCRPKLQAAYDYKVNSTQKPTINSTYMDLFKYNLTQIQQYNDKYKIQNPKRNDGTTININDYVDKYGGNEIGSIFNNTISDTYTINELWKYKNSSNCPSTTKTRTDIYVKKEDSYETMMSYDIDQINVYTALWQKPVQTGAGGSEKRLGIEKEWESMLKDGKHTDFFMKHSSIETDYSTGKTKRVFTTPSELIYDKNGNVIGEKTVYYDDTTSNDTDTLNQKTKENKESRQEVDNQNDISNKSDYDTMGDADTSEPDSDLGIAFQQPKRIEDDTKVGDGIADVVSDANDFINDKDAKNYIDQGQLADFSNSIYNILLSVGVVIAVIVGMILGIKLMLAPIGERAEAKKMLIPYAVGCAVVFGAFGIWKIVVTILQTLD